MDEELNEAVERLTEILSYYNEYKKDYEEGHASSFELNIEDFEAIETILNYIQNSIPKKKVEDKIKELEKQSGGNVFHIQQTINAKKRLLNELLEE